MSHVLPALALAASLAAAACSPGGTGAVTVTGSFSGEATAGAELDISVMGCPFETPPAYSATGIVSEDGAYGEVAGIEAGDWCVQTFIDMVPDDGVAPIKGRDATVALDAGVRSIPVRVRSGEATQIAVTFEVSDGGAE
ncbi:MAG: hypothetical protein PHU25_04400 [Deltaproteobacteria bacterium]|nr:hypothetical protein [Deltaproteobacteria bacterium]